MAGWRASGTENHAPGLRGPNYHSAFVLDPDGKTSRRYYVSARNSPRSQPAVVRDFIGSTSSTTRGWTSSQSGHPNVRMSEPDVQAVVRASIVIVLQFGHVGP